MGKAGEKQKRRPKIKDKKQSERFKEAARKLGADKDIDVEFDQILKTMAGGPKYQMYRHRIYNAHGMIKPAETPFPAELKESEWKPLATITEAFKAALGDLKTKGYHLYEVDMTEAYGGEEPPSDKKQ